MQKPVHLMHRNKREGEREREREKEQTQHTDAAGVELADILSLLKKTC